MLELTKKVVPWLLAAMVFAFGWHFGSTAKDAHWKEVVQNEYVSKQTSRVQTQAALDEISAKYQADLEGLEGSTDRVIADLRSDNKWLRVQVKPTSVSAGPDGRCLVDGSVELHEATARSLIAITQKADLKEKALQDTIRKLQGKGGEH
uniref:Rz-like spanin n=1 Tax=Klebsiella phage vB_Kpn24-P1 TaxID=3230851 RepID=A0AAU8EG60_9VIRU